MTNQTATDKTTEALKTINTSTIKTLIAGKGFNFTDIVIRKLRPGTFKMVSEISSWLTNDKPALETLIIAALKDVMFANGFAMQLGWDMARSSDTFARGVEIRFNVRDFAAEARKAEAERKAAVIVAASANVEKPETYIEAGSLDREYHFGLNLRYSIQLDGIFYRVLATDYSPINSDKLLVRLYLAIREHVVTHVIDVAREYPVAVEVMNKPYLYAWRKDEQCNITTEAEFDLWRSHYVTVQHSWEFTGGKRNQRIQKVFLTLQGSRQLETVQDAELSLAQYQAALEMFMAIKAEFLQEPIVLTLVPDYTDDIQL